MDDLSFKICRRNKELQPDLYCEYIYINISVFQATFICLKIQSNQYCEILYNFKMPAFYFNIF